MEARLADCAKRRTTTLFADAHDQPVDWALPKDDILSAFDKDRLSYFLHPGLRAKAGQKPTQWEADIAQPSFQ